MKVLPFESVIAEHLGDPKFRAEWERTALARAVAARLVAYRAEYRLSQRALAERLGVRQPVVARLELGEHNPSLDTLRRLSEALGMEFLVHISPTPPRPEPWPDPPPSARTVVEAARSERSATLVAVR